MTFKICILLIHSAYRNLVEKVFSFRLNHDTLFPYSTKYILIITYQQNFLVGSWSLGVILIPVCLTAHPSWNSWTGQGCKYRQEVVQQNAGLQHHECPTDQMLFPKRQDGSNLNQNYYPFFLHHLLSLQIESVLEAHFFVHIFISYMYNVDIKIEMSFTTC